MKNNCVDNFTLFYRLTEIRNIRAAISQVADCSWEDWTKEYPGAEEDIENLRRNYI